MTNHAGWLHEPWDASNRRFIDTVKSGSYNLAAHSFQAASVFTDKNEMCDASFAQALRSNVHIASIGTDSSETGEQDNLINIGCTVTGSRQSKLSPDVLARNWGCTLETAQRTLDITTQLGIRTVANPSISWRL